MNTIFITGGEGFIGSNLVNYLVRFYNVVSIDNRSLKFKFKNSKNIKCKYLKISIGNNKRIQSILKKYKPKAIINLAASTHVDESIIFPNKFITNNLLETFKFVSNIKKNLNILPKDFKFIHVSTDEVYGDIRNKNIGKLFTEESKYAPNSPYSSSKASMDLVLRSFLKTYNFPVIIIHPANNYGPSQNIDKFIPKIIFNFFTKKKIPIYGRGLQIREWTYVKDNCKAIRKILLKGQIGEKYNIGSGIRISNIFLVKKICRVLEKKQKLNPKPINEYISFVKDRPAHDFMYAIDSSKIKSLGWKPSYDINKGVKETINWYIKQQKKIL